ncbi:unnamed protein product [Nezara viridula]|uniref:Uncharacterized protein n=1 Tax=Nezara viridula TaxID=85310 RepID=A0A9P0GXF6_NEZVI|nr:unnamed protein product [Nezara viridula]
MSNRYREYFALFPERLFLKMHNPTTLLLACLMFQAGQCFLEKQEAIFKGALGILKSSEDVEERTKAVGQLTSVFDTMKDEINYLREENAELKDNELDNFGSEYGSKNGTGQRRNLYPWDPANTNNNQWSQTVTTVTSATSTTTRRPKTTKTPEIKTLSTKEREMHEAATRGWDVTIAALCAEGVNPNTADINNQGNTPLHLTVAGRHLPAAMTLIKCGANVNAANTIGNTSLHLAIGRNDNWMTGLLLLAKANPFISNTYGAIPYQMAAVATDASIPGMMNTTLLAWFAGWRSLNDREVLSRNYITNGYYVELSRMCIEGWIDPNLGDANNRRNTVMHIAATSQWNHPMVVQALVRCGANVNIPNLDGNTPLHLAISNVNAASTLALLLHGADPYISNTAGQTPYALAQQSTNAYIKSLFSAPRFQWYLSDLLPY